MWTLYDFLPSGNGYKVRLTLRELNKRFQYREVNIVQGESRTAAFLAKNPFGQIPVLELEDGARLAESTAILLFLAEGTPLLPSDPIARARTIAWMCFEQTHVDGVISRARFRRLYPDAIPTRPEEFEAWWREGEAALKVLEARLQHHPYLVEDRFTLADIALYAYVHCAEEGGFDLNPYAALRAWFERVEARPTHLPIDVAPSKLDQRPCDSS